MGRLPCRVSLTSPALATPLLEASSSGFSGGGSSQAQAPTAFCQAVWAVLSDGPDPVAHPVGYALSQIAPPGQIHTSDHALVNTNGSDHAAATSLAKYDTGLHKACPGVVP